MEKYSAYAINRYKNSTLSKVTDDVICEYPLTIFINDMEYVTLMCTPEHLKELVVGFLKSDHIIDTLEDINAMVIDEAKGLAYVELEDDSMINDDLHHKRYITSGCSSSAVFYDTLDAIKLSASPINQKIDIASVLKIVKILNESSEVFTKTGGVHLAGLFENTALYFIAEDIGRHNAVDKVLGKQVLDQAPAFEKIMAVTGRISSEIVLKCAKSKVNIIISRSAPMDRAIDIAKKLNMTLIGFVRGERANIYAGLERFEK